MNEGEHPILSFIEGAQALRGAHQASVKTAVPSEVKKLGQKQPEKIAPQHVDKLAQKVARSLARLLKNKRSAYVKMPHLSVMVTSPSAETVYHDRHPNLVNQMSFVITRALRGTLSVKINYGDTHYMLDGDPVKPVPENPDILLGLVNLLAKVDGALNANTIVDEGNLGIVRDTEAEQEEKLRHM